MSTMDTLLAGLNWQPVAHSEAGMDETPFATHSAVLHLMGHEFRCYQLSDGRRILDKDDVDRWFHLPATIETKR